MQDTFLLDEVRCGFLIPAAIKQAWAAGLEVLMEIDRVCKKHNIQYFADWGTLLGTVRHGGYIPWDDDLDIVMKREDYIKFMTIARFDMEEGFDVQTFRNHEDCWLFMGKVVGRNGFCFEKEHLRRFHNFPYISCVDIFVLDYVYRDPEKEEKRRDLCKYMLAVANSITEEKLAHTDREYRLQMLEKKLGHSVSRIDDPVEMKRYLYGEIEKIFAEVPEQEADKLTQLFPWGLKGDWFQFPKEYYAESVSLPFEYTYMPVPKMYDKMLRQRYGDYVKLVKNAGAHGYPFFESQKENLQKVLDFELPEFGFDVAKMYRNEAEDACKALSYKAMAKTCLDELMRMKEEVAQMLEHEVNVTDASCVERVLDLLAAGQQLAIELGNMLEQFFGEDCSIISFLEQYCEIVYGIYSKISGESDETATDIDDLEAVLAAITDDMKRNIFARKTVLFLPVLAKDWDSLKGLWQEYTNNPSYDVFVVPLPYYYKDYDGSPKKLCYEITEFPSEIQAADYNLLTPEYLEMLHPEIIVIQNPYDSWNPAIAVPEMFYSLNLRKYTDDLIYVPPVEVEEYSKGNEREYSNMRYYVTMPGVVYADHVLVQSENMRQVYVERLVDFAGEETREVWEKTVIAKKLCDTEQEVDIPCRASDGEKSIISNSKKRMLYGISLGTYIADAETAQAKIERNLQVFEEYGKKMDVTMMIFPDSDASAPVREYLNMVVKKYSGIVVYDCGEAECSAKDYDAYYGDVMPLVMEFRDAGKPVMIQDIYIG